MLKQHKNVAIAKDSMRTSDSDNTLQMTTMSEQNISDQLLNTNNY
ncbi:hypothetical protein [Candidatus Gullanella endobia]|nr:hypothetical protein [Candidatus Gullanella endobia]